MTPRLTFRPGARAEIRDARRWYEGQVRGLGRAFLAEVDATLAFVRRHPEMDEAVELDGAVRRALLHRLPYALVYIDGRQPGKGGSTLPNRIVTEPRRLFLQPR